MMGRRRSGSTHLVPGVEFTSPRPKRDFAALIVVLDPSVARDSQAAISERIVRDGCRYAVCTGHACSTWDTSVDAAYLAQDANWSPPEDRFVMTTSHQDESLEEAIEHFHMRTAFNHFVPTLFLAIIIGGSYSGVPISSSPPLNSVECGLTSRCSRTGASVAALPRAPAAERQYR